jgi:formate dehydrogenase beta subunit
MRLTSICGLGQVALGPAISVMGLKRGGTEARPQPRPPRPPDGAAGADGDNT